MSTSDRRERWRTVQDLFHRARELEPEARRPFLVRHCAGDATLLAEVGELLEDATSAESLRSLDAPGAPAGPAPEDLSGREFGAYRLLRILGQGSMGVIYEARQRWVERSVALKILRRRGDVLGEGGSAEVYERMTQRFLAEAEVLGLLDHPGIVPIHALEQEGERTYFTMRLVRGDDFRDVIARMHAGAPGWGLARALGVVLRVCETMAFAHDRGVLHRDLKPSHVMVGSFGEVYLVDWGLAKLPGRPEMRDLRLREEASERRGAEDTHAPAPLRTVEGDVIGTPAYMPPEQARGELGKLGAGSDVYAVGALLYHLLVGRAPYLAPGERVSARTVLERVRAGPPPPVSNLAPAVPPALAAIVGKAMERESRARYPSMEALADDLRAFLENRVVAAHRTGALVALEKWLQRNRGLAGALALGLALVVGWGASVVRLQGSTNRVLARAVDETTRERDRAREQAAIATATTDFLDELFRSLHPLEAQGEDVTVRAALDRAAARLEEGPAELPLVEASIRATLGVAYRELGLQESAEPHLARAYRTRLELLGERDGASVLAMEEYGVLLRDLARFEESEPLLRRALALRHELHGPEAPATRRAAGHLAQLLLDSRQLDEAADLAQGLLAALERDGRGESEAGLVALEVLGTVHYLNDRMGAAEPLFRRQLAIDRRLFGDGHSNTLIATSNLAAVLDAAGRHAEALELGLDLVQRLTRVFGERHRDTLAAKANAALMLANQGRASEGIEWLEETAALERDVFGPAHPRAQLTLYNLAELLRRAQRFADARPAYEELLELQRARLEPDDPDLRRTLHGFADCLMDAHEFGAARELLRELLVLQERNPGAALTDAGETLRQLDHCDRKLAAESGATGPGG